VRRLTLDDDGLIAGAVAVFAEGLGPGYVTAGDLAAVVAAGRPEAAVLVGVVGAEVAGAAIMDRASPALLARMRAAAAAAGHPLADLGSRATGQLRTGAVRRGFRRQGLGAELMTRRLALLRDAGCTSVVALAWLSGRSDTSEGLLRAHGFERVAEIPDCWQADPPDRGPPCPVCGLPCRCTGAVHVLRW
jgi:ribosomal protein S18 acetylase RimI-like enzyme